MNCCTSSALKLLTNIFNFIIFICGAVVFGLGIWSAVDNVAIFTLLNDVMLAGVYVLIIGGAIVMINSFIGCYGTIHSSRRIIVAFCTIALIAIGLKIIGCILLYNFYEQSADFLQSTYKTEYRRDGDGRVTKIWDRTQKLGSCCGWWSHLEWVDSKYFNETGKFPESCCVFDGDFNSKMSDSKPLNEKDCQLQLPGFIHDRGCVGVLRSYYYGIGLTTIFIIVLELISVIFIVAFYQHIP